MCSESLQGLHVGLGLEKKNVDVIYFHWNHLDLAQFKVYKYEKKF